MKKTHTVIALSGGMDSASLALHLLAKNQAVTAISFDYGQKHIAETLRAKDLCDYLSARGLPITHHLIKLDGLSSLLHSHLTQGGDEVPEGHYEADNMKATVVPNRNKIFSSIIQAAALSIAQKNDCEVNIALGIHAGDHTIYPDCRQAFRDLDYQAFLSGNWQADRVNYETPYINLDKTAVLADGLKACEILKLDNREVYARTMTSYKPLLINEHWYSDYKSASSVERIEAFIQNKIDDPLQYADENGPQSFAVAKAHVLDLLKERA